MYISLIPYGHHHCPPVGSVKCRKVKSIHCTADGFEHATMTFQIRVGSHCISNVGMNVWGKLALGPSTSTDFEYRTCTTMRKICAHPTQW